MKKKTERFFGRIKVLDKTFKFSLQALEVHAAISRLQTLHKCGYTLLSIERNGMNYPYLAGTEVGPRLEEGNPLESELMPGMGDAYGKVREK